MSDSFLLKRVVRLTLALVLLLASTAWVRAPAPAVDAHAAYVLTSQAFDVALLSIARDLPQGSQGSQSSAQLAQQLLNPETETCPSRADAGHEPGVLADPVESVQAGLSRLLLNDPCAAAPSRAHPARKAPGFPDPLLRPPRLV